MLRIVTKYGVLIAWFILVVPGIYAQQAVLPVTSFSRNDYRAANQNWDITTDDRGLIYVANHQGLLVFNGQQWHLYTLPNRTIIRSVFCDGDRVYTGSYEEFGYWKENGFGEYEYTSLTSCIDPGHEFRNEEFWEIVRWGPYIVFRSFASVYMYNGEQITVLNPDFFVTKIAPFGEALIIGGDTGGIYHYTEQGGLMPFEGTEDMDGPIADIVADGDEIIIGTKSQGCYSYDIGLSRLKKWSRTANAPLEAYELNKVHRIGDKRIAFGTIKNGVVIYDRERDESRNINRQLGLQNNTVLGMDVRGDRLWLALDNGVDMVGINSEFSFFEEDSGELGTVYDIAFYNNTTYLGSNTGVYYFEGDRLVFLENSQGHVWDLEVVNGRLLCGHNSGTYDISDNTFEKISGFSGGYGIREVPGKENTYIQGTYIGLARFYYGKDGWEVSRIAGIDFPIDNMVFENRHTVWASHPYKGLFRIKLNGDYSEGTVEKTFNNSRLRDFKTQLFRVGNEIVLYNSGNWYTYDPDKDDLLPYKPFTRYTDKKLLFRDKEHYWFADPEGGGVIYTDLSRDTVIGRKALVERFTPQFEKVVRKNDSLYYFTLNDGFAEFNLHKYRQKHNRLPAATIQVSGMETGGISYAFAENPGIPFAQGRDIRFSVYYPHRTGQDFRYRLTGPIRQEGELENSVLALQNLAHGDYSLQIWPVSLDRDNPATLHYHFRIYPPWYLSITMKIVYLLLFLAGIYLLFRWNKKLIEDHQRKLTRKMYLEKQRKLEIMERENLEREVKMKRKELMNSTLMISKKNELLLEIQNELRRIRSAKVNEYRIKSLIARTTEAIHNQEDWQVFETNFNELHEDFFKRLVSRYPTLTTRDIKLCGYLKMNLASKEIAPLMGITIRGVEIQRYRLRKKLGLDKDQDLVKYLLLV